MGWIARHCCPLAAATPPRRGLPLAAVALASLLVAGSSSAAEDEVAENGWEPSAMQAVSGWLDCEECREGQIDAVMAGGESLVPALEAALLGGPSDAQRDLLTRHLVSNYLSLKDYEREHGDAVVSGGLQDYVGQYAANYDAQVRARAAMALAAIGGARARAALESARSRSFRSDVEEVLDKALAAFPPAGAGTVD